MKFLFLPLFIAFSLSLSAQKISKEDIYPVPQTIKAKWPKIGWPDLQLDECLEGNCTDGQGTRLLYNRMTMENNIYYLYFTLLKGQFSNGGKDFNGKAWQPKLRFNIDNKKNLVAADKPDFSSETSLQSWYLGEGQRRDKKWEGEAKPAGFSKKFPGVTSHKIVYNNDQLVWMDISLPAGHRFTRYTGRVFISGDFLSGKATLPNGDVYEGFFFKSNFFGPGRLVKKNGTIRQGIWQFDSLVIETPVELAKFLFEERLPARTVDDYKFSTEVMGIKEGNPPFYGGTVTNNEANGWAQSTFYRRNGVRSVSGIIYGQWKQNKLDGPAILVVTPTYLRFDPSNSNSLFNDLWYIAGIFKDGVLIKGTKLFTHFSTYPNQYLAENDIYHLSPSDGINVETGNFANNQLDGCGTKQKSYGTTNDLFIPNTVTEGKFVNGTVSGFYFEYDGKGMRNLESLRYTAPYILTAEIVKEAEANNDLCFDVMRTLKPQYIAAMKKRLAGDIAAAEEAKKPPPPFNPYAHLQPETKIYNLTSADFAKVDWEALGYKAETKESTREYIHFLEEVSADVRKYLNETYTKNGSRYKRYSRSTQFSVSSASYHSGQQLPVAGKKVPIIILHYCQRAGSDGKATVSLEYEGKKIEGNKILTGGKCEMITQCSGICKTSCDGAFEFEKFTNRFYSLFLQQTGNWSGSRTYWVVLKDEAGTE